MQQVNSFAPAASFTPRPHATAQHHAPLRAKSVARPRTADGIFVEPKRRVYLKPARLYSSLSTHQAAPSAGDGHATPTSSLGASRHTQPREAPHASRRPAADTAPRGARRRYRLVRLLRPLFIIFGAIAAGFLIQSLQIGEIAIAVYAILALLRRIESRTTFMLALFSLLGIIILLIIRPNNQLAANFAVYTFLLLVVGAVTLGREIRAANA